MKCDWAQQQMISYIYGELGDEQSHELELHVHACDNCRKELQAYQTLRATMSVTPIEEPSPNLLTQCRIRLEEALDQLPPPQPWMRIQTSVYGFLAQMRAAPGVAMGLAVVGFLAGGLAGNVWKKQAAQHNPAQQQAQVHIQSAIPAQMKAQAQSEISASSTPSAAMAATMTSPQIFNVSGIVPHPDTHMVVVHYSQIVPETMEGSMDDPAVRQLLLAATRSGMNAGVQNDSVNILSEECRIGHFCEGGPVRTALMVALRYDRDASVRAKALDGLEPYVAADIQVRDAVLEALMHDPSPQVRSRAIHILQPVQADSSVRVVLQTLAHQDQNSMIRNASSQALQTMPATQ